MACSEMPLLLAPKSPFHQPRALNSDGLPSKEYAPWVPPRQAYSHSASVGSRYFLPVTFESQRQYVSAACGVIVIAGSEPLPQPWSGSPYGGVAPVIASTPCAAGASARVSLRPSERVA